MENIKISIDNGSMPELNDRELVNKAKRGDTSAFEELVKRYEKKIYNLAFRLTGKSEDASDILQETFLNAFYSLKTFRGEANFFTWLYRIALNLALAKKRKEKHKFFSLDAVLDTQEGELHKEIPDWSNNPDAIVENKELKKILYDTLAFLPEEYRAVVVLRDMEGLSNKDVSKILNLSLPAVKSRLHRGRLFLREKIGNYFNQR